MAEMKYLSLFVFSVLLISHYVEGASLFNGLMKKVFATVSMCTNEVEGKISPELCISEFDVNTNPNDAKFEGCRQAMTCAVKKMEYMTPDGQWDQAKLLALKDGITNQEAIEDFDKTYAACSSVGGTDGEAVTNMISCILENSQKAKQSYNEMKDTFLEGYDM